MDNKNLSVDGEPDDCVLETNGSIKKANFTFIPKFLWLLVRYFLSPTTADNIVTLDRAVQMVTIVVGFEVDFTWLLKMMIHERAFKATTTYPLPCMVFK